MDELARHVIDIDIYHTDRDKWAYNGGLFWHTYHYGDADTATHRTYPRKNDGTVHGGGPSADHNYPTGLMLRYFLTGDIASRDAALGLSQYVLNLEDWRLSPFRWLSRADTGRAIFTPPGFFGPARSSGNSLNALVDGHRLSGDARFLRKADQLVRRVIHPLDDLKGGRFDEPEYRWFYAMFLQSLGKYLRHKADLGQIDRPYAHGRASLLAYARWMVEHEYPYLERPEKLEHPTETWAAQDIRKSDIFCHAAMHASGAERRTVRRARRLLSPNLDSHLARRCRRVLGAAGHRATDIRVPPAVAGQAHRSDTAGPSRSRRLRDARALCPAASPSGATRHNHRGSRSRARCRHGNCGTRAMARLN